MDIRRIASNATFLIIGKILSGTLNVITLAMVARYLGVEEYGTYSFCLAYFLIVQIIATFGVDSILVREIARDAKRTATLLGQGMLIKAIMALVGYVLATTTIRLLAGSPENVKLIHIFSLCFLVNVVGTPRVLYEARLQSVVPGIFELLGKVLFFSLVILGSKQGCDVSAFAWFYLAAEFFGAVCLFLMACRHTPPMFRLEMPVLQTIMAECWPIALTNIFIVIYFRVDTILLQFFKGSLDVGYYSSAYFVLAGLMFIPEAFSKSIFPVMAEVFHSASRSLAEIFRRSFKYMLTICLPTSLAGFMLAEEIIHFIYGANYAPASGALKILSLAIVVMFLSYIAGTTLVAMDRQKDIMWIALLNAMVNVSLNILWIPKWSFIATSLTTVITEGLGCLIALFLVMRRLGERMRAGSRFGFFPLIAALFLQFVVLRLSHGGSFLLFLPLAFLAYAIALIGLQWLDGSDWAILRELFNPKKS